jgi:hypothetical protein
MKRHRVGTRIYSWLEADDLSLSEWKEYWRTRDGKGNLMLRQESWVVCPRKKRDISELVVDYRERAIDQRITRARIYQPEQRCMCALVFEVIVPQFGAPSRFVRRTIPSLYICYACDTGGNEPSKVCLVSCCPHNRLSSYYMLHEEQEIREIRTFYVNQVRKNPLPSRNVKLL